MCYIEAIHYLYGFDNLLRDATRTKDQERFVSVRRVEGFHKVDEECGCFFLEVYNVNNLDEASVVYFYLNNNVYYITRLIMTVTSLRRLISPAHNPLFSTKLGQCTPGDAWRHR